MKVHDEVFGMTIESEAAAGSVSFQGKRYYFCSGRCEQLFSQHPERYVESNPAQRRSHVTTEGDERGPNGPIRLLRIPLVGLSCIASNRIGLEKALAKLPGVRAVYVNPVTDAAHLEIDQESFDVEEAGRLLARHGVHRITIPPSETWPASGNGAPTSDR